MTLEERVARALHAADRAGTWDACANKALWLKWARVHRLAACQAYQMTTPSPVPTNTHPAQQATDMSRAITCA